MTVGQRLAIVHDGRLQQVGTPAEIYRRPANRFVAGFVGTPPMNFIDGHAANGRFEAEGLTLTSEVPLPDGAVTMGIRPEDVAIVSVTPSDSAAGSAQLSGRIDLVEDLGSERRIHVIAGRHRVAAIGRGWAALQTGDAVGVKMDLAAAHWFAAGRRVGE